MPEVQTLEAPQVSYALESFKHTSLNKALQNINDQLQNHPEWRPSAADVQALFCLEEKTAAEPILRRYADSVMMDEEFSEELLADFNRRLPWPSEDAAFSNVTWAFDEFPDEHPDQDYDESDDNLKSRPIIQEMLSRMTVDAKVDFLTWFFDNLPFFLEYIDNPVEDITWLVLRAREISLFHPAARRLGESLAKWALEVSHISSLHEDDPTYQWYLRYPLSFAPNQLALGLGFAELNENELKQVRSLMIVNYDVASTLNAFRAAIDAVRDNDLVRQKLEAQLASLLGLDDVAVVHSTLEEVYESIDFSQYPLSKETESNRIDALAQGFSKHGASTNDRFMTIASGTGWETKGLFDRGFRKIIGIDISPKNLGKARELFPEIDFVEGSWYDVLPGGDYFDQVREKNILKLEPVPGFVQEAWAKKTGIFAKVLDLFTRNDAQQQADATGVHIHCTGWSIHHCENASGLETIIAGFKAAQDVGDLVIIDARDPAFGITKENIERFREVLLAHGYPPDDVKDTHYVVDGPPDADGVTRHFYNRYIPPIEDIILSFERAGYALVERKNEIIPTGHGDQSAFMIFKKSRASK